MIRTLRVRNLAVIAELELELDGGLNVLTGETGAGKSVLLQAIALLCGRRVASDAIRAGGGVILRSRLTTTAASSGCRRRIWVGCPSR